MEKVRQLCGNGSFDSPECLKYLEECDVVITNPPFSLFRQYVKQLMDYGKKFIVIGNMNSICCKEIFPYFKNNEIWFGVSLNGTKCSFIVPKDYVGKNVYEENGVRKGKVNNAIWFTNIEHSKRNEILDLYKKYNEKDFPKYDNYNAIEVSKTCDIPLDYKGVMGVPITFLFKHNPKQFEIVGAAQGSEEIAGDYYLGIIDSIKYDGGKARAYVNGKGVYSRILIRKKNCNFFLPFGDFSDFKTIYT